MSQMTIEQALARAAEYHQAGRLHHAETLCRRILSAAPAQPKALYIMGSIALQVGRADVAIGVLRRAIAAQPHFPEALNDLGIALRNTGQFEQAVFAFRQAVAVRPDLPQSHNNLGSILQECDQPEQGAAALREALKLKPDFAEAHNNLGNCLQSLGRDEEAIECYRQALSFSPKFFDAHNNLANALRNLGLLDETMVSYHRALTIQPNFVPAWTNMGIALLEQRKFADAIAAHEHAISLQPDWPLAHYNLGLSLLMQGNFERGFAENEWRTKARELGYICQDFPQPRWNGEALNGRTILLHTEQGFGDAVQFIRYLPQVVAAGGRVILQCQTELLRLFTGLSGVDNLIERGRPLQAFDVHCPLMSLPLVLKTRVESIPAPIPYLHADPRLALQWRERLTGEAIRVGVVWAGRPDHQTDRRRSITLPELAPLATAPNIQFFSLQKGREIEAASNATSELKLIDWTSDLHDFADTAALIDNLDLVISVDTAVAHLAGALGKRVWVLLPYVSEWRWLLDRSDSPWYPSMQLFRQTKAGDWKTPINAVADALLRMQR